MNTLYNTIVYKPYCLFDFISSGRLSDCLRDGISSLYRGIKYVSYEAIELIEEMLPRYQPKIITLPVRKDVEEIERDILTEFGADELVLRSIKPCRCDTALSSGSDRTREADPLELGGMGIPSQRILYAAPIPLRHDPELTDLRNIDTAFGHMEHDYYFTEPGEKNVGVFLVYDPSQLNRADTINGTGYVIKPFKRGVALLGVVRLEGDLTTMDVEGYRDKIREYRLSLSQPTESE